MSKIVNYSVIGLSSNPSSKDDRYYMSVSPKNPADAELNPKGRFGFTYDQLGAIGANLGMDSAEMLIKALNKGGCTITLPAVLCKVGDEYVDQFGNLRKYGHNEDGSLKPDAKDWWKFDTIQAVVDLSDSAVEFMERVDEKVLVALAASDIQRKRDAAATRKAQALARISQLAGARLELKGRTVADEPEPADDTDEPETTEEATPPTPPRRNR